MNDIGKPLNRDAATVPAPHLMAWLTILVEVFGGLAVLLGALVPLVSVPMAAVLLVAIFNCPSTVRVQYDQADERDLRSCPVRTAGLRV